ncbi:MAG: elongation factor P [Candidatus Colwellbacteria bacterium]|nr:elongation factor P [Candidatus Colwellbacteria bacterium]
MLAYNELKPGKFIVLDGEPWEILDFEFLRMQQRKPVSRTKLKNLSTGKIKEQTFHQSDKLEEAELVKDPIKYIYSHREENWFTEINNPSKRFSFKDEFIGEKKIFLRPNMEVTALKFEDKILGIQLPIKAEYKVIEAPPAVKGNTAQGGTKLVTIEGGAKIQTPLFINEGDILRVNIETGEYVERV